MAPGRGKPSGALLAATAVLSLAVASTAGATRPEARSAGGSVANVYLLDVGAGTVRALTKNPATSEDALAYSPALSPDRKHLAFAETLCHFCSSTIRVASVGSGRWLGSPVAGGFKPAWSPDGRRLVYVTLNGSLAVTAWPHPKPRVVIRGGLANDTPSWSPRGGLIAFTRQLTATNWQVFTARTDGSRVRAVTHGGRPALDPAWAPDGKRIAFAQQTAAGPWQICTADRSGSAVRCLPNHGADESEPTWSPDGRRIAYVVQGRFHSSVWIMRSDGSGARRVSPQSLDALQPRWSTNAGQLVFVGRPRR
jgi:TolB protein